MRIKGTKQGVFLSLHTRRLPGSIPFVSCFRTRATLPQDVAAGQASGKCLPGGITVVKERDTSSHQIHAAMMTNEELSSVLFEFAETEASGEEFVSYIIELTNATIAKISYHLTNYHHLAPTNSGIELAEVSFAYQKITLQHKCAKTALVDSWTD
jgi:type VI secretion system secreted protein Hcp